MAITKAKKQDILAKLGDVLKDATSVVFVRFHKLSVADASKMRVELKKDGVGYMVAKKTLIRRALTEKGYTGEIPELPGEVAIAWSTGDSTVPAGKIHEHAKKLKGALELIGGVFENAYRDLAGMTEIATIPSLPALRGMFANIINSPKQRFAIALSEVAKIK